MTSGVQFNQWKVLLLVQGSTNQTRTIAVCPEIIILLLLADRYICFQLVCVCFSVSTVQHPNTPEYKKYKMKLNSIVNSTSQIGRFWSNVTPRSFWPMSKHILSPKVSLKRHFMPKTFISIDNYLQRRVRLHNIDRLSHNTVF